MDVNPIALQPSTLAAIEAVQRALQLARDTAGSTEVHAKAGRDVVTDADVAAESVIIEVLTDRTGLPVVGEAWRAGSCGRLAVLAGRPDLRDEKLRLRRAVVVGERGPGRGRCRRGLSGRRRVDNAGARR
jgi:fructose-1,6-bisphosphatase/inositol monophosphatase family enzyme